MEIDYGLLKQALRDVLDEGTDAGAEIAARFRGGTLIIKPRDESLQPKEVPIEDFFRKVVRIRDNLRILEQKVNSHPKLEAEDRRTLQGYVTKCYGTLTTFNLLFQDKGDQFVGQKTT
ncbi:MAG: hypothetical protein KF878_29750 [Planctomycetes bacterium]|nr:hypothetical protein [Planctomycetota bacterium]